MAGRSQLSAAFRLALACLLAAAGAGCAGSQTPPAAGQDIRSLLPQPSRLAPAQPAHRAAANPNWTRLFGADYQAAWPNQLVTAPAPPAALYSPAWDPAGPHDFTGLAFAIYDFDVSGFTGPPQLSLVFTDPPPAPGLLWLGLALIARDTWEWRQYDPGAPLDLGDLAPYIRGGTELLCAVVLTGTAPATLESLSLGVRAGWETVYVDPPVAGPPQEYKGSYCSLSLVDGNPAVSYLNESEQKIAYARALDPEGESWGGPALIGDGGGFPQYCSLYVVDGWPAIAYFEGSWMEAAYLKYARALDAQGSGWPAPLTIGGSFQEPVGNGASLCIVDGNPAVSYYQSGLGGHALLFSRSKDADGAEWSEPVVVDLNGSPRESWLLVVDGLPAIAYLNSGGAFKQYVYYARAKDADGAGWGAGAPIYQVDGQMTDTVSMALVNGNPAIAFDAYATGTTNGGTIFYCRADDAQGSAWGAPLEIDSSGLAQYPSLAVVNGKPAVAFYNKGLSDLLYVEASDADGAAWNAAETADSGGDVGHYASLIELSGKPAIAYAQAVLGLSPPVYEAVKFACKY